MKWIVLLTLFAAVPAWATTCNCEVFAVAPLTASRQVDTFPLGQYKTKYYGDYKVESQASCRKDCRATAMKDFDANVLREQLVPWTDRLVANRLAAYNCAGPADFKIPVRVRARMGKISLGLAHEAMVFIHRERSCF